MRIPYGISNYGKVVEEGFYYVDKTPFIPLLEKAGDYLFLLRPRRFGKSLWMSTLEFYYDLNRRERFQELFGKTAIGRGPTAEQGRYCVLGLDFSAVSPDPSEVKRSFNQHVWLRAYNFLKRYQDVLGDAGRSALDEIRENRDADFVTGVVTEATGRAGLKIYLFIDEYDNFANTILASRGPDAYEGLTHGPGFYRAFFNVLKSWTRAGDSPLARLLVTGVSPLAMDDVTSGFNIGENLSLDVAFNDLFGFTRGEVLRLFRYYGKTESLSFAPEDFASRIRDWCDHYRFAPQAPPDEERLFNPDMVLYLLKEALKNGRLPEEMIDHNVKTDYGKLRHLVMTSRSGGPEPNGNFDQLRKISEEGFVHARIVPSFPAEEVAYPENFVSLLFYLGLLTIGDRAEGASRLVVPNETVRRLHYEYLQRGYREAGMVSVSVFNLLAGLRRMAWRGE